MEQRIGFIGCGNMASAMIGGMINSGVMQASAVFASDKSTEKLQEMHTKYGITVNEDNAVVAQNADIIFLAVKPHIYLAVMKELTALNLKNKLYISIAAGKTIDFLESGLGSDTKIIRTMPNTPALVGTGITAVCPNKNVLPQELEQVMPLFEAFGEAEIIHESLFDAVIAAASSSPAYVFMFIDAMSDAAVKLGMPRIQARKFAAQAVLGSAKMVLETGKHPGELKDMVCSPAGTTIEAVRILEEKGFRSAVIEAMTACAEKSKQM